LSKPSLGLMAASNELHVLHWMSHQLSDDYALTLSHASSKRLGRNSWQVSLRIKLMVACHT